MTLHTTNKLQLIQMEGNSITKKPFREVVDIFFPLIWQSLLQLRKAERLKLCFSIWTVLRKTVWNQICYSLALSWVDDSEGGRERSAFSLKGWCLELRKKALWVITSCQFQFQKQIPPTCQQPSINFLCQNEYVSQAVSFGEGFYDTNKTLKLLTAHECGFKKKVLTICNHLNSSAYLGKYQTKMETKKELFELILSLSLINKTSQDGLWVYNLVKAGKASKCSLS